MLQLDTGASRHTRPFAGHWSPQIFAPGPRVAKPELRQHMEGGAFRPAIHGSDSDENVFDIGLRVLDKNVKITVPRKNPGIEQLEFRLATPAALALLHRLSMGKGGWGIFEQHSNKRGRGCK